MSRPTTEDYLRHLRTESARFREVMTEIDPAARVPGCPEWDADDLLWHLTGVQDFWAWVITHRPRHPEGYPEPTRPEGHADLLVAFDTASGALSAALEAADPAEPAWSWSTEQTVGFTVRRQALEALVHRLDAEQTAGRLTSLDPVLAADGVDEALGVMYAGAPPWGTFAPSEQLVRFACTDTGSEVVIRLGRFTGTDPEGVVRDEDDLELVADPPAEVQATVSGPAAELLAWVWNRGDAVSVEGEPEVVAVVRGIVGQPID